jgi:disulfide oxidoreductase YuzD
MQVSKITEVTIFESPDGGRTVYARNPGSKDRTLHWQDPNLQRELEELESQKRWVDIFQARRNNAELDRLCEQAEILYELSRRES